MPFVTTDRGAIEHFAGFHHLSPAIEAAGAPAFSAEAGDGLARCGWERFFRAMDDRGLALAYDPDDATSARFTAAGERSGGAAAARLSAAVAHSRRFWRALFLPGRAAAS